jgi:L-lactate dehydrogenase
MNDTGNTERQDQTGRAPAKIAVIGCGNVGTTFAYALLLSGLAAEIVLVDNNRAKAEGEAMDLNHSVPLTHPTRIRAGEYPDCSGATVTVVAAGVGQKPGESRLDLNNRNAAVFREIIPEVARVNPGLPSGRVIGSGTILDTARFRHLLSQHFGVDARSVHAYIIGEHGDSEVPVWSLANIAGMRLDSFSEVQGVKFDAASRESIFRQTRTAAYEIISRKGATYYAVAVGLLRIVEAILRDQKTVLSLSSIISEYYGASDVAFSLPTVLGRSGVQSVLRLQLDPGEIEALRRSAQILTTAVGQLHLS